MKQIKVSANTKHRKGEKRSINNNKIIKIVKFPKTGVQRCESFCLY